MLIFAIDDEKAMLTQLHNAIEQAEPGAQIMDYNRAKAALDAISDKSLKPDVVFSDIEMPGMTGLALAIRIKEMSPDTKIIFVTAYSEYALEAYKKHVNGYLLKPVEPEMVREELDALDLKPSEKIGGGVPRTTVKNCRSDVLDISKCTTMKNPWYSQEPRLRNCLPTL